MRPHFIHPDIIFQAADDGILASNYRTRTHVWMNSNLFLEFTKQHSSAPYRVADYTTISNVKGLLDDPSGIVSNSNYIEFSTFDDAIAFLRKKFIYIDDEDAYLSYLSKKTSILDKNHLGTFHQKLGTELHLKQKLDPAVWWYNQKFDSETGALRDNLYFYVQEVFLKKYLMELDLENKFVLDFGCGSGMAAERFINHGAIVYGIDPDQNLLSLAKKKLGSKFIPITLDTKNLDEALKAIPENKINLVWLSDVFLFYFYPQSGDKSPISPTALLTTLCERLGPMGKCVIMQSHGVFWLAPWLGAPGRPFTVITEYMQRLYTVAPGVAELSKVIRDSNLYIEQIYEPIPFSEIVGIERATKLDIQFAKNFPVWWVYECIKHT